MIDPVSPQPSRRGFFGAIGAVAAALVCKPTKALAIRAPAEPVVKLTHVQVGPADWVLVQGAPVELTYEQLANMRLSSCAPMPARMNDGHA